jgi:predicted nucleotidyltransferase
MFDDQTAMAHGIAGGRRSVRTRELCSVVDNESVMTRQEAIEQMTLRLVEFYHPDRIYLFGSEARGDAGLDSDLDFLVIVPDDAPEQVMRSGEIYSQLSGFGVAKDVIPWRRSDFERRAVNVKASLPATVLREGRLLYESA